MIVNTSYKGSVFLFLFMKF
uniref:Uncharacterized protein n=1 Tax=Rhizophora mucronata TaxID=61149 RepID=A0A2P2QEA7_RHIMU